MVIDSQSSFYTIFSSLISVIKSYNTEVYIHLYKSFWNILIHHILLWKEFYPFSSMVTLHGTSCVTSQNAMVSLKVEFQTTFIYSQTITILLKNYDITKYDKRQIKVHIVGLGKRCINHGKAKRLQTQLSTVWDSQGACWSTFEGDLICTGHGSRIFAITQASGFTHDQKWCLSSCGNILIPDLSLVIFWVSTCKNYGQLAGLDTREVDMNSWTWSWHEQS